MKLSEALTITISITQYSAMPVLSDRTKLATWEKSWGTGGATPDGSSDPSIPQHLVIA